VSIPASFEGRLSLPVIAAPLFIILPASDPSAMSFAGLAAQSKSCWSGGSALALAV
jgi:hypothetical protein